MIGPAGSSTGTGFEGAEAEDDDLLLTVLPEPEPVAQSVELARLVLLDGPGNQETWFLARAFEGLAGAGVRGVVSFADPVPRRSADGKIIAPGHIGCVYQERPPPAAPAG